MLFNSLAYMTLLGLEKFIGYISAIPAVILLGGSFIFYLFAGAFDTAVFCTSIIVNWIILVYLPKNSTRIFVAVVANIGLLFFFKYINIFTDINSNTENYNSYIDLTLPLGISFYTFQILSHQIDVVRGDTKPAASFRSFSLFIAFFPQLIAGPIVRSRELLPQIERLFQGKKRKFRLVSYGLGLFLLGLFKKVVLADSIAPFVDEIFLFGPENALWAWLGSTLFAFQIYLDFSGYSDMAIGSAYLLGIRLPINFKTPYLSKGPREFWQRWHITLSTWIKDYLYIPLGGGKGNLARKGTVVIFTMAVAGLWHGAGLTFVLWGALWGIYILSSRIFPAFQLPTPIAIILHFFVTVLIWVLFRAPNWRAALEYYKVMLGIAPGQASSATFYEQTEILPVLLCVTILLAVLHFVEDKIHHIRTVRILKRYNGAFLWTMFATLAILIILLPRDGINPFIYFRF
jgi:alginate O-acetyltransferase complex protein AlgI